MRRWLWLVCLLLLTGCDDGLYSGTLIFNGDHTFMPGTRLPGDVFVRAGTAEFAPGSRVAGSIYMLGGSLAVNGTIDGDLALLGGRLVLGPQAEVGGDLRLGGGEIEQAATAVIHGQVVSGNGVELPLDTLAQGQSGDDTLRALSAALLLAGFGALLARRQSRPLITLGQTAVEQPLVSAALGLLLLLVLPALLVMMAFTVILIPLVIVLGLLLLLLLGYGLTAVGYQLGTWLSHKLNRPVTPAWAAFIGSLVLLMSFELPYLGGGLLAGTAVLLLGAMLLTRLGLRPYTPDPAITGAADPASYARRPQKDVS